MPDDERSTPQMDVDPAAERIWHHALTVGHRHPSAVLPGSPKCVICRAPLGGIGSPVARLTGRAPSRKNPNFCNYCEVALPPGGTEVDIGVLYADVRGSTGLAERMGDQAFSALLGRFYKVAIDVIVHQYGLLDKLVGDEVVAFFTPVSVPDYRTRAVRAAIELQRAVAKANGADPWLPLGIGVHAGPAFVGKFGSGGIYDFTALGDTMNTGARLQAEAKPGEIVMSEEAYAEVARDFPGLEQRTIQLRGRDEPITVRVLRPVAVNP